MEAAAEREEFEEAARLRDRLFKIERTLEKQRITQTAATDQDVIGLARQGTAVDLQLLFVRGGLLIGRIGTALFVALGAAAIAVMAAAFVRALRRRRVQTS